MSNELTVIEADREFLPAMSIDQAAQRFSQLTAFVSRIMHKDVDFGAVPGTDKPTLLKPGAEKLCTFFGLRKVPELVERVEDWTGAQHGGEPFFYYSYRFHLYRGDVLIASADGSCNTWEKKYRWRQADRVCPRCGKPAILRSKQEPGWFCWKKKDGCGASFAPDDPEIVQQKAGRVPNPDVADVVNTVQKMAQKRALVAATLLAVNASEFFTQDMEDLEEHDEPPKPQPRPQQAQPRQQPATQQRPQPAPQPAQYPAAPPKNKPGPLPPADTAEMAERVRTADDWLAKQGRIESGELVAYVNGALAADGLAPSIDGADVKHYVLIRNLIERYVAELNQPQEPAPEQEETETVPA